MSESQDKINAIYELRDAVETKVRLEATLDREPKPGVREAFLEATLDLEAKTQHAIEVCHECGHQHAAERAHHDPRGGNVIEVDFRPSQRGDAV